MASRMANISNLFADQKTRMIVVLTGVLLISMVVWGFLRFTKNTENQTNNSSVTSVPNIESIPDPKQQLSQSMAQNLKASDQRRIDAARQGGSSALPTLLPQEQDAQPLPDGLGQNGSDAQGLLGNKNANGASSDDANKLKDAAVNSQLAALSNELASSQQQLANSQALLTQQQYQAQQKALEEAQKQQQKLTQNMQNQGQALIANWTGSRGTPTQVYVQGKLATDEESDDNKQSRGRKSAVSTNDTADNDVSSTNQPPKQPASIKAGDVVFGILNTKINSDEPGPILATIVSGKYRGAKLVGAVQQSPKITGTNGPTTVILSFNIMSIKNMSNSISVNVIAIDPDTARTALASEVDFHRLYRYGTLFASSFLSGYGSAITSSGSVTFNNTDGSQTTYQQELNPTETFLAALGGVGTELGDALSDAVDRPNTITVNSGVSLGLLFLDDVTIDGMAG